jgi:PKD repeat protein
MRRNMLKTALLATLVAVLGLLVGLVNPATTAVAGTGTPVFANYAAPSSLFDSGNAGEPSIGINGNTGALMYQSNASTYKVTFNDGSVPAAATWRDVTPLSSILNIDPILATDWQTGRTFAGGLDGECSILSYSDNDGSSWIPMANPCAGVFDHETIGSGPWHGGQPAYATYPHAVYYCAQNGEDMCATSTNGGLTFLPPVPVLGACGSLHGHVKVSHDGTAYVPNNNCGKVGGAITSNNGLTWNSYTISQSTSASRGFDPSVTTTPDDTMYEAGAQGGNDHPYVARSLNHGGSWDRVTDLASTVSPPIVASTFQSMVSGDNGRIAVAFLGTTNTNVSGSPFDNGYHGVWNLYVSFSYDGGQTWQTVQATSDPVQRGCIWDGGGSNSCRNLLDFMDANVTPDGRVVVGYADGCIGSCAGANGTEAQSTSAWATVARESTGKGLYAAFDGAGSVPSAPTVTATPGNGQVGLSWTTPSSSSTITGYNVYRGTAPGAETLLTTVGAVNSYTDTAVTNGTVYYYTVAANNASGTGAQSAEVSARPSAGNTPPTACFTHGEVSFTTTVDGSCSSDLEGAVTYSWSFGDASAPASGVNVSHTYSAAGTYTVTLTVTDTNNATSSTSQQVTVPSAGDPDPSTPNLVNGVATSSNSLGTSGSWQYFKINVPPTKALLDVELNSAQTCNALCSPDLNVAVLYGARPTAPSSDCPQTSSSDDRCLKVAPQAGYWYVGVYVTSGGPATPYTITATYN